MSDVFDQVSDVEDSCKMGVAYAFPEPLKLPVNDLLAKTSPPYTA